MVQLCNNTNAFLGAMAMVLLIIGILLHVANFLLGSFFMEGRPKPPKKPAKKPALGTAGSVFLALAFLCIVLYLLLPPIINLLLGSNLMNPCNVASSTSIAEQQPYCGKYCDNQSIPKSSPNCTCDLLLEAATGGTTR